jgi:hypothetical protein
LTLSDATVTTMVGLDAHPGNMNGTGAAARFDDPEPLAGSIQIQGYADGTGPAALFNSPGGIAIGPSGSLLISDFNNVVREVYSAGAAPAFPTPRKRELLALQGMERRLARLAPTYRAVVPVQKLMD